MKLFKLLSSIFLALLLIAEPSFLFSETGTAADDGFGFSRLEENTSRFRLTDVRPGEKYIHSSTETVKISTNTVSGKDSGLKNAENDGKTANSDNGRPLVRQQKLSEKRQRLIGIWKNVRDDVDTGFFQEKIEILSPSLKENLALAGENAPTPIGPQLEFRDSGTSLHVTGRKLISVNYQGKKYIKEQHDNNRDRSTALFEIKQEMQVKMHGKVGEKISVNIDYDDTKNDKQDISVVYNGTTDEIVRQVVFGDINMTLPATEFVSYNKQLFGIRADLNAGGLDMSVIASRTKGDSRTKKFTGNTSFSKTDIYDTSYIRRRYYDVTFGHTGEFTIRSNTEKIYIDRQNSAPVDNITVFEMTAEDYDSPSTTYTGRFRLMKRGVDYVMDYANGIVKFSSSLPSNAAVIIDYTKSDGTRLSDSSETPGRYRILKAKDDKYATPAGQKRELKTYYSIGVTNIVRDDSNGNFSLVVQDLSHNEVGPSLNPRQTYSDTIEMDFEQGVFHLLRPFGSESDPDTPDPQVYAASPSSKRIFHIEYSYKFKTFTLDSGIVPDSESVRLDGKKLTKNIDYYIDYDSGFITFYNPDRIGSQSVIEISYEVSEFGGTGTQTMIGGRASYKLGNVFSIGSTMLYQGGSKKSSVPEITEIANSNLVYEADIQLKNLKIGRFMASLGAEAAFSKTIPNLDDYAIVENLENSRIEDSVPMDKTYWAISANPTAEPADPTAINWENESVKMLDINPNATSDGSQDVLYIDYDFNISNEVSVVYPLSITGLDFSNKSTLEFVVWGEHSSANGVDFNIDFGQMNEDADDTGGQTLTCSSGYQSLNNPKTEDINCDGQVSSSEDIGWLYAPLGKNSKRYGASNGRLDTADLNRNGRLDGEELSGSFGYNHIGGTKWDWNGTEQESVVNFSGWRTLTVPMGITNADTYLWNAVKQVRISLRDTGTSKKKGRIKIARISAVGNTWSVTESTGTGSIAVAAVNNIDNTDYTPIYDVPGEPMRVFNSLYGSVSDIKSKNNLETVSEQALRINFSSYTATDSGYVYRTWSRSIDIGQHKYLKFLIRNDIEDEKAIAYFKAGSPTNYFMAKIPLNFTGWRLIELEQYDDTGDKIPDYWINRSNTLYDVEVSSAGKPSLQSLSQIIMGLNVSDDASHNAIIYLDDIYVEKPIERNGQARKAEATFEMKGWFKGGGKYLYSDRSFQTPVTSVTNQDREYSNGWLDVSAVKFFPISLNATRETTITPNAAATGDSNYVSTLMEGRIKKFDGKAKGTLNIPSLPKIDLSYARETTDYNTLSRTDGKDMYTASISHTFGRNLHILPKSVSGEYTLIRKLTDYRPDNLISLSNVYDTEEITEYYSTKLSFIPWKGTSFAPTYSRKNVREEKTPLMQSDPSLKYPKAMEQKAGFTSTIRIAKWLAPTVSYNISTEESNNISTNNVTSGMITRSYNIGDIKTITRSARGGAGLTINMNDIFPKNKHLKSMILSGSYSLEDGDSWYYVEKDYNASKNLWIRKRLDPKNDQAMLNSLTSRDTYNATFRWSPMAGFNFKGRIAPLKTMSVTNNFTQTRQHSEVTKTVTDTSNITLPDTVISMSQLENMLFLEKWVRNMALNVKYSRNKAETKMVSRTITDNYSADLRAKVFTVDSSLSFNAMRSKDIDAETNTVTEQKSNDNISAQGAFDWGKMRLTTKVNYTHRVTEATMGIKSEDTTTLTPSLLLKTNFSLPKGLRLPFMKKAIALDNKIVFTGNLSYAMSKSPITATENNNLLTINSSLDYEVTKNLRITVNGAVKRYWAKKVPEDDYMSYEAGSTVSFQF